MVSGDFNKNVEGVVFPLRNKGIGSGEIVIV